MWQVSSDIYIFNVNLLYATVGKYPFFKNKIKQDLLKTSIIYIQENRLLQKANNLFFDILFGYKNKKYIS